MKSGKKIYFASDQHFGVPTFEKSKERENLFVKWLDEVKHDAEEIFLLGDLFDFWFEYKTAVPKGFIRVLGKIAEITDSGIPVHLFTGNHDMWMFGYLPKEIGVNLHYNPIERSFNNKVFYIGHGDGLGPGDYGYKFIKQVFRNPLCQWLFARLHPNFGIGLANYFSSKSRIANGMSDKTCLGEGNEWLAIYSKERLKEKHYDYFVFGHRHLPLQIQLNQKSVYINTGDWVSDFSFVVFDGSSTELYTFKNGTQQLLNTENLKK
jgi:UDP-2,3-diacylglucosamine hydrolase